MDIAIMGTGKIGTTLGRKLAGAGHQVVYGSREPGDGAVSIDDAVKGGEVVIVAIPGPAVESFATDHGSQLAGKLVLDASNKMGEPVANSRSAYETRAPGARYGRVFNCLGVEVLEDPNFGKTPSDMFFACHDADRATIETLVADVGLRPVYVGSDATVVDGVFRLWIALAMGQQRGRHLGFRTLDR